MWQHGLVERVAISIKTIDQIDLLREQQKVLSEEVAIHLSALKRVSQDPSRDSEREFINAEIAQLNEQIKLKNEQIQHLEDKSANNSIVSSRDKMDEVEQAQSVSELEAQLNEKSLELEVKAGDNRVLQEQLNQKAHEVKELKQKVAELTESKEHSEARNKKLAEESSYAKGLASAAAVELKALSEEVSKLMNTNERLSAELASQKNSPTNRRLLGTTKNGPLLLEKDQIEYLLQRNRRRIQTKGAYLENELANMWVLVAKLRKSQGTKTEASESSRDSQGADVFEMWKALDKLGILYNLLSKECLGDELCK
ncbi:kinesin-like protein KIN-7K, chloroplastic [Tanacetum coccineum]